MPFSSVEISLFAHRLAAICEEMGAVLRRSAISPNIRDREDFSCALFDEKGSLISQAAHIPVHLGSMAFAMRDVIPLFAWQPGDVVLFNDPFLGGTHLPDITVVAPLFIEEQLVGFSAARAHHADIGGVSPGSMGVETRLEDEGVIISPCYWYKGGVENRDIAELFRERVRAPVERLGDLSAQKASVQLGAARLRSFGATRIRSMFAALSEVTEAYGRAAVRQIPDGDYYFEDALEDDGCGSGPLIIRLLLSVRGESAIVDFSGTSMQTRGPVNCPLAVTAASVYYVFRCLMPAHTPQTASVFQPIEVRAPEGCLVNAGRGAAVAAGNVETSQRIVDVLLGALAGAIPDRIPAAAQGTMNNVIFGGNANGETWVYYETIAGGMGAHAKGGGQSAVQCHMTNTRNSSIEVLEMHYPLRINRYAVRKDSGGSGCFAGGDGVVREWEVLEACHLSLLTERRSSAPYGLAGGLSASSGINSVWKDGCWHPLPGKGSFQLERGERIRIETPGGGGFGERES